MVAHGEPVRLVAHVLEDEERLGAARDHEGVGTVREVHLFEALRETDVRDVQAELLQDLRGHAQLPAAAVDHDERRRVREPPALTRAFFLLAEQS